MLSLNTISTLLGLVVLTLSNYVATNEIFNLTSGLYKSIEVNLLNRTVYKLLGVPYANIPFTFEKSVQFNMTANNRKASRVRNADKWSSLCVQPILFNNQYYGNFELPHEYDLSLNCLTINLFIPKNDNRRKLNAMIFIHGGSNAAGSSTFIDATALASIGDVIVAMPNYRLDVLGFFNKPSDDLGRTINSENGNYGLWDQQLAIKWLYSNCDALGCDKNTITLFGHSAGASDTMLLSFSSNHVRPYIKRIIMQSGSALAHWSFVHEAHLLSKIKELSENKNKQRFHQVISQVNFKNTKYANALNDTFNNFIIYTTCNSTSKFTCLETKIQNFYYIYKLNKLKLNERLIKERILIEFFKYLFDTLDMNEIVSFFGYVFGGLMKTVNWDILSEKVLFSESVFETYLEEMVANKREEVYSSSENEFLNLTLRSNRHKSNDMLINGSLSKLKDSRCYSDMFHFINGIENLILVCEFLTGPYSNVANTLVGRYFISCFRPYYMNEAKSCYHLNSKDYFIEKILSINSSLVFNEMKVCYDTATTYSHESLQNELNKAYFTNESLAVKEEFIYNSIRELSFITENPNYLNRPNLDGDLVKEMPHRQLDNLLDIEILMGVTSHESFYFLLHDFSLKDIFRDTFIYSSLLNLTDNLVIKLIELNRNRKLNFCLRRRLFELYNFKNLTIEYIRLDTLKNNIDLLELISDYDFVLPLITHLKNVLKNESNITNKKLFVYEYSYSSKINYLLDYMKEFSKEFEKALLKLNYEVIPHFSELDYVFGLPILTKYELLHTNKENSLLTTPSMPLKLFNYTEEEYNLSLKMINYWSNFAKYGNPNKIQEPYDSNENEKEWNEFTKENPNIFRMNSFESFRNSKSLIKKWLKKHEFWYEKFPNEIFNECFYLSTDKQIKFDQMYVDNFFKTNKPKGENFDDDDEDYLNRSNTLNYLYRFHSLFIVNMIMFYLFYL